MQQPAYQLAHGEHQEAGLCLAVIEGRAHKYSANAIYRSIRTGTSIVASMGQIGHDSQEGCQAQAKLNRYLCHLARHELRSSQGLGHCLADGERDQDQNQIPKRFEHRRSKATSIPKARPLPYQWASQELGSCLADGERDQIQGDIHPKGSAVTSPMGKLSRRQEIQSNAHPKSSAIASPMGNKKILSNVHPKGSAVALPMGNVSASARSGKEDEGHEEGVVAVVKARQRPPGSTLPAFRERRGSVKEERRKKQRLAGKMPAQGLNMEGGPCEMPDESDRAETCRVEPE
ncbi:hypothetical protein Q7P36_005412 [Cladosporium allicinum]